MAASFPGQQSADTTTGRAVAFDIRSGVTSGPLDNGAGTGALTTGIGFGPNVGPQGFTDKKFSVGYIPGKTKLDGSAASNATYYYLGGGASKPHNDPGGAAGEANTSPITSNYGIGVAGGGLDRDDAGEMKVIKAAQDTMSGDDQELDSVSQAKYVNVSGTQVRKDALQFGVYNTNMT